MVVIGVPYLFANEVVEQVDLEVNFDVGEGDWDEPVEVIDEVNDHAVNDTS